MDLTIKPAPVRKTLVVRAAPEKAFEIFTADFDRWQPRPCHIGETPPEAVILEPGVGGRWYSRHEGGMECSWGEVLVWEPPSRLVLAWRIDRWFRFDPSLLTEVELRFTELGDGRTRIDFEHRHLERFGERDSVARSDKGRGVSRIATAAARALAAVALVSGAPAADGAPPQVRAPSGLALPHGEIRTLVVHGRALESSWNGDSADRPVEVYLPPYYATGSRRYPVLYLLHGYKGSARQWISDPGWNIQGEMDKSIAGGLRPMIIVMPDARTRAGGSYYVNSRADGAWEKFISSELVGEIDRRFRTIASFENRGIAGHSMGGYGALYLAFHHPRVFGSVYALSPCCLSFDGDLSLKSPEWRTIAGYKGFHAFSSDSHYLAQALAGMAIAWSPDRHRPPFHADFPVILKNGELEPRPRVARRWTDFMIVPNIEQWWPNIRRLCAIGFDAGEQDQFTHIPIGERRLDAALDARHGRHLFELYEGDHNSGVPGRITGKMLPFFSSAFRKCDGIIRIERARD